MHCNNKKILNPMSFVTNLLDIIKITLQGRKY